GLAGVLWAAIGAYGGWRLQTLAAAPASMPVTVVQANRGPARQTSRLRRTETFEAYLRLTRDRLRPRRPRLVAGAGNTASFYLEHEMAPLGALEQLTRETNSVVLVGGPRQDDATGVLHNAAYAVGADGVLGRYDKVRLVPFAEYAPLNLHAVSAVDATFAPGAGAAPIALPRA